MGNTPLVWAAGNGHEAVVELLLGWADLDTDKPRDIPAEKVNPSQRIYPLLAHVAR